MVIDMLSATASLNSRDKRNHCIELNLKFIACEVHCHVGYAMIPVIDSSPDFHYFAFRFRPREYTYGSRQETAGIWLVGTMQTS
jgi:hypothetical protein